MDLDLCLITCLQLKFSKLELWSQWEHSTPHLRKSRTLVCSTILCDVDALLFWTLTVRLISGTRFGCARSVPTVTPSLSTMQSTSLSSSCQWNFSKSRLPLNIFLETRSLLRFCFCTSSTPAFRLKSWMQSETQYRNNWTLFLKTL